MEMTSPDIDTDNITPNGRVTHNARAAKGRSRAGSAILTYENALDWSYWRGTGAGNWGGTLTWGEQSRVETPYRPNPAGAVIFASEFRSV